MIVYANLLLAPAMTILRAAHLDLEGELSSNNGFLLR